MATIDLLNYLSEGGISIKKFDTNNPYIDINENKNYFDVCNEKYHIEGLNVGHKRILDLSKPENYSVVMLLIKLFKKRLFKKCNYFRKTMTIRT